jgi:primosomal replication protein N
METTNKIEIIGSIENEPIFDHEVYGEKFYSFNIKTKRLSDVYDVLPVIVSERLIKIDTLKGDSKIKLIGQLRSYNHTNNDNKIKLILKIFTREIELIEDENIKDKNIIELNGYICKKPNYRNTLKGRQICDLLLAVNRNYKKSDYIPTICWGRNSSYAKDLNIGSNISIFGRLQSREYNKKISEEESETRIAYEVSASKIELISEVEITEPAE